MLKMNGIEATEVISKKISSVKSLIFSMHNNQKYILKSVEIGAWGYLLKDTTKEEILKALRTLAMGEKYFTHNVSNVIITSLMSKSKNWGNKIDPFKISKKEKTKLKLIVDGLNSREIAEKQELIYCPVDNQRARLMKRLRVKNGIELVKIPL